ncbi:MAG: hypothetical protein JKY96_05535, partial [Phycisphaerales bacterium]|nr:hypothetical protein [Phycisphaerales bacterium]
MGTVHAKVERIGNELFLRSRMATVLIVILSFVAYIIAYRTYGRYLSSKVFQIDPDRITPACELEDGVDFVPSRRSLVFGHHFT